MMRRPSGIERIAFQRLGRLLLTVFLISTVVFFVVRILPGDPALVVAGIDATPDEVRAIRARLGTDRPLAVQYGDWLWRLARLDLGDSLISGVPVVALIGQRFPLTLSLAVLALAVSLAIALPLGVLSAVRQWSAWDFLGVIFSQVGLAIPSFWLGILLLMLLAVRLPLFPLFGWEGFISLVLPGISLGVARAAILTRLTRVSMVEELGKEYVVTARAKGLTDAMVKYKHALRNALLPVVTVTGIQFGYLLGGAIIIEQVFSLPGLGRLFLSAVYQRDFPLIQGGVIFTALLFCLVNFAVDVLYVFLNPRIRIP